jgi:oleate hydratase
MGKQIITKELNNHEIYDLKYSAKAPEGIENRKAYIIGGGIAGLSAAVYWWMTSTCPVRTSLFLKHPNLSRFYGRTVNAKTGYLCRGEREMEPQMECLWNISPRSRRCETPDVQC